MNFVVVLPSIYQPWTDRCLKHACPELLDNLLLVDNTEHNRGVAGSWNLGVDRMFKQRADWLVVLSAGIRFDPDIGGRDFLDQMEQAPSGWAGVEAGHGMGWHLIAFRRRVFRMIGRFDENFFPAYWEDNDFARRMILATSNEGPLWTKVPCNVSLQGFSHGVDLGGADTKPHLMAAYYQAKWGSMPGGEFYTTPFNCAVGLDYWPQPCEVCRHPMTAHTGPTCSACPCTA